MPRQDALYFYGNNFSGPVPAILPRYQMITMDPCGIPSPLTGSITTALACTEQAMWMYGLTFAEPHLSEVHFCAVNSADGSVDCGSNHFDCPIPQVPQAFHIRNVKNDPYHGYCGCTACQQYDAFGNLLRECDPACDMSTCQCECVPGQHFLVSDGAGGMTLSSDACDINPYDSSQCSPRVSKFSYSHWVYDSVDCACPSGNDCGGDETAGVNFNTDACRPFCSECQPGRYSAVTDNPTCDMCAPGHYSSQYGQSFCDACSRGKFSGGGGASGGGACQLCEVGKYGVQEGAAECASAPLGTFVNFQGAYCLDPADKTASWTGTTCDMLNASEQPLGPRHCNAGYKSSSPGAQACTPCECAHVGT
jgi:hypothetical protein